MKIREIGPNQEFIKFETLADGTPFHIKDDENKILYMKTENTFGKDTIERNCIRLSDGKMFRILNNGSTIIVNAEIVILNE